MRILYFYICVNPRGDILLDICCNPDGNSAVPCLRRILHSSARPGLTTGPEHCSWDKLRVQAGFAPCWNNADEALYRIRLALTGHSITAKWKSFVSTLVTPSANKQLARHVTLFLLGDHLWQHVRVMRRVQKSFKEKFSSAGLRKCSPDFIFPRSFIAPPHPFRPSRDSPK